MSTMNPDDLDWEPPTEAEMKLIEARRERSDQISKLMSSYLLKGYKMLGSVCSKCDTILLQDRQGVNYCVACSELESDTTKDDPVINETAAMSMAKELEFASAASATENTFSNPVAPGATAASPALTLTGTTPFSLTPQHNHSPKMKLEVMQNDKESNIVSCQDEVTAPFLSMSSIDVQSYTASTNIKPTLPNHSNVAMSDPSLKSKKAASGDLGDSGISSTCAADDQPPKTNVLDCFLKVSENSVHVSGLIEKIEWASRELKGTHSIEYSIHLCQLMKIAGEAIVALRNARV